MKALSRLCFAYTSGIYPFVIRFFYCVPRKPNGSSSAAGEVGALELVVMSFYDALLLVMHLLPARISMLPMNPVDSGRRPEIKP